MDTLFEILAAIFIVAGILFLFVMGVGLICEHVYGLTPVWLQ